MAVRTHHSTILTHHRDDRPVHRRRCALPSLQDNARHRPMMSALRSRLNVESGTGRPWRRRFLRGEDPPRRHPAQPPRPRRGFVFLLWTPPPAAARPRARVVGSAARPGPLEMHQFSMESSALSYCRSRRCLHQPSRPSTTTKNRTVKPRSSSSRPFSYGSMQRHPSHSSVAGYGRGSSGGSGSGPGGRGPTGDYIHEAPSYYGIMARRAAMAMGMAYAWTEYVVDMTLCEGPSMSPTIQPYGEIVVMDRWNPRHFGLRDGDNGEDRSNAARRRQADFEKAQRLNRSKSDRSLMCWHEPALGSASELQTAVTYMEMWRHVRSPISVGDVLVVQHPRRKGTVCKRVVGLPGDQVLLGGGAAARASQPWASYNYPRSTATPSSLSQRQLLVVPDGHVWLEGDNPGNSSDSRHYGPVPAALIVGRVLFRAWPIRGSAWMVRAKRPEQPVLPRGYGPATTVVLPAGYDGQPILQPLVHEAVVSGTTSPGLPK